MIKKVLCIASVAQEDNTTKSVEPAQHLDRLVNRRKVVKQAKRKNGRQGDMYSAVAVTYKDLL